MFFEIRNVLNPQQLERLRVLARTLPFIDGRATNPDALAKQNLQLDQKNPAVAEPGEILRDALFRNPELREIAFPRRLARPTLCKYEPGMHYGRHVDESLFPAQPTPMRADVSCTVFVSDPADYDGGELTVHLGDRSLEMRGAPGSAIVYPSTTLHEVRPVTRGARIVAVAWMQSYIADDRQRELLRSVHRLARVEGPRLPEESRLSLEALRTNLFRMWSEVP